MKEFQKINPAVKDNYVINKYPQDSKSIQYGNKNLFNQIPKKNLPELKFTKMKMRPVSDPEIDHTGKHLFNTKKGFKYSRLIPKINKNHALIKEAELMFPKINSGMANTNNYFNELEKNLVVTNYTNKHYSKRKNFQSTRNAKTKTFYGFYGVKNLKNNLNNNSTNNKNDNQHSNNLSEKTTDTEKNNIENYCINNAKNENIYNLQRFKPKIPRFVRDSKSLPSKNITKVKKSNKKEIIENNNKPLNSLTIKPIIKYPKYIPNNLLSNNIYNNFNNSINNNNYNININNNIIPPTINMSNTPNNFRQNPTPLKTANLFNEYELMTEKLNMIQQLFSSIIGHNPFYDAKRIQKTVELSPEIFHNNYKNFIPSVISSPNEFTQTDLIKGYAYNSSMGNIRDYNEDTITVAKIIEDKGQNDFYFFGVYDGHGGSGCSLYLKNNLHNFVNNFSKEAIKQAIEETEENFLKSEALDEKGEIKDSSGSCGIMAMIQKNRCIIANVGDSRLVIYKNKGVSFSTKDHKPGSETEKERITKAGGKIYQSPSLFPLFQNGKEIEIPWRVLPGRLSVSRTFGDIEAKEPKFGGNKNVVVPLPDITEIELEEDFNLIVLGCDGIFDVLSNEEILECVKFVLKEKKVKDINEVDISELCGDFAGMIIKSALAKDSFDNVSCIVIAINIKELID